MVNQLRIAHLTSVHARGETRIFLKQCSSLAAAGHDVTLIVADGLGDEERNNVRILDVGKPASRMNRMVRVTRRMLRRAIDVDADVYHFHDPELLPSGLALKRRGKKVVYDAHENLPEDVLSKIYIPHALRKATSLVAGAYELYVARRLDCVVTATPAIRDRFEQAGITAIDVNNFPILGELEANIPWSNKKKEICYVGGIATIRGIREVVAALSRTTSGVRLNLAGRFAEAPLRADCEAMPGWSSVNELGFLDRTQVREIMGVSVAGVVTYLPAPNQTDAQPNKMFEYMSAGLPVIASNFPLWRKIVEGNNCGICVDPLDPVSIAKAIDQLVDDPSLARQMGENGRKAVAERYNWGVEERKLLALYENFSRSR